MSCSRRGPCLHENEDIEGPNCGPCLSARRSSDIEPNWKPAIGHNGGPPFPDDAPPALPPNPKAAHGASKPSLALFPGGALIPTAKVFELGAAKYGPFNWRKDPVAAMTYANAALRHLVSWIDGRDQDPESGQSDLAHGIACFAILLDAMACGTMIDDRPHKGTSGDLIASLTTKLEQPA